MLQKNLTPNEEKKTLLGWKQALALIIGIFSAGVVTVIVTTSYLDERASERFYDKSSGLLLEQKVRVIEERATRQEEKLDNIQEQQIQILLKTGEITGKIDNIISRNAH